MVDGDSVFTESTLPQWATANYSDGSKKQFGIQWNLQDIEKVDTSKPGNYTITGILNQPEYGEVLVEQRAAPPGISGR